MHGSNKEVENLRNTMSLAFEHVWRGVGNGDTCSGFATQGIWFTLKKDMTSDSGPVPDNSTSIRHITESKAGRRTCVLDLARARLAYILAEFGLLLLKTPWILSICRCRLRCMNLSQKEEYLIIPSFARLPPVERGSVLETHERVSGSTARTDESNGPATTSQPCWCNRDPRPYGERHLPYLGLLLAEIATRKPVTVVKTANASPTIRIDGAETTVETLTNLIQRTTGSVRFTSAVQYCLASGLRPEEVQDCDLSEFYRKVFIPSAHSLPRVIEYVLILIRLKSACEGLLADQVRLQRHLQAMGHPG